MINGPKGCQVCSIEIAKESKHTHTVLLPWLCAICIKIPLTLVRFLNLSVVMKTENRSPGQLKKWWSGVHEFKWKLHYTAYMCVQWCSHINLCKTLTLKQQ